ncbi:MAG TPA: CHAT domain-containing protein [Thermoanaerobaculia bacterium]|nr:CHAT domain-containing protein [Thermoanaerobaculia bacterium]
MKRLAIAFILCGIVGGCHKEKDTAPPDLWVRTVEPRLTRTSWKPCRILPLAGTRVVQGAACGEPVVQSNQACSKDITDHADAVRMLSTHPRCIQQVIDAFERFARGDARIWSDVSAAYYVRAQREDRASDLLAALAAAERALQADPHNTHARFNLALAQEALGFSAEARSSWSMVANAKEPNWSAEAQEHLARLRPADAMVEWQSRRQPLAEALKRGNRAELAKLIEPFPRPALLYFEFELLQTGDAAAIALFANVLHERLHDRYVLDVASAAANNKDGQLALQQAPTAENFERAERLLQRGRSPLYLEAKQKRAVALLLALPSEAKALAAAAEREARPYPYLHAQALLTLGYVQATHSEYVRSIIAIDESKTTFIAIHDFQSLAQAYRSNAGNYRLAGQYELSMREAIQAMRLLPKIAHTRIRHGVIGETAGTALALGHPSAALMLQDYAVATLRGELTQTTETAKITEILQHLAVAVRERARIELVLNDYTGARRDLRESERLLGVNAQKTDKSVQRWFEAALSEVEGRALLSVNPIRAASEFTRALERLEPDELRTLRASLLLQRAEAQRKSGRAAEAENDLDLALKELALEERDILQKRARGQAETIWTPYFARFEDARRQRIRQLMEQGDAEQAFARVERMHAFEPLDLVLHLDFLPPEFRKLTKDGPISRKDIQANLLPGTVLLQYCVTPERTFVWILSREQFQSLALEVRASDIQRWTRELQNAGRRLDTGAFVNRLDAPYQALLAPVLEKIVTPVERLVIIPDGAMHGLPFAALHDSTLNRHLLQLAPVEIDGSATLYIFSLIRDRALGRDPSPSALLVGNPTFGRQWTFAHGLEPLRYAEEEVQEIRALYERADVLTGGNATTQQFLAHAQKKSVVHFAGHALVFPTDPEKSLLLLAPSDAHSGALEAQELLTHLKLDQTRLVVLSACSSAGGFPVGPEGVAPLVRPLIAAGVPAVLGTLWDVNDATAKQLSVSFHRHYEQGHDAAKALQLAQLDLLRTRGSQYAVAWASFQVIGHASSPFESTQRVNGGTHLGIHRTNPFQRDDGIRPQ